VRPESTRAIVLRSQDYGESDEIVTLLTHAAGKLAGIAKGAKRSKRRFAGSLEIFSHVLLEYRPRPGADLVFLERAQIVTPWRRILDSLERYAAASHVVELADKMTAEREVGDELYLLVLAALRRIDAGEPRPATLRLFELAMLAVSGYRADFSTCHLCRRPLANDRGLVRVGSVQGGVSCRGCLGADGGGVLVSPTALANLHAMQRLVVHALRPNGRWQGVEPELYAAEDGLEPGLAGPVAREVGAALQCLLAPHLRGRLKTLELLGAILGEAGGAGVKE
jgi:DNA repair protein RecO (recombination protein O)